MATTSVKTHKGIGMEGFIAQWYATQTRKSLGEFQALAWRIAAELSAGSHVLEVAPGPGYFAVELAKLGGYHVTGLDISQTFVEIAKRNAVAAEVDVDFQLGNVAEMPFADGSFDFLLCRAAFKNFAEPLRALNEMHRVLKPGGHALIIDLRRDASPASINQAVDQMHLSFINRIITKLAFRTVLLKRAGTQAEFERLIAQTPFRTVKIDKDLIGLEIRLGK